MSLDELVAKAKGEPLPAPSIAVESTGPANGGASHGFDHAGVASVESILGGSPHAGVTVEPRPPAAPVTGEALIATLDGLTPLVVRLMCIRSGVRFTAELTRECRLNEAEKQQLRLTADAAAPLFSKVLEKSEYVAVGVFGVSYAMIVDAKIKYVRSLAPAPKPEISPDETASVPETGAKSEPAKPARKPYTRTGAFAGVFGAKRAAREAREGGKK